MELSRRSLARAGLLPAFKVDAQQVRGLRSKPCNKCPYFTRALPLEDAGSILFGFEHRLFK